MNIYKDIDQRTDEWFKLRGSRFTASEGQAVANIGKGLETLVYKKVAFILTGKEEVGFHNADTDRGNLLEMKARNAYELETDNTVETVGFCELDEYVGASPDGFVGSDGLIEIKCKNDSKFVEEMLTDKIDSEHLWQCQFQLYVTDRLWVDYTVYNPNFKKSLIIKRIERDEKDIEKIKAGIETGKAMIKSMMEKLS
jgi:exodeoxyribonuclease (lambda-induced)